MKVPTPPSFYGGMLYFLRSPMTYPFPDAPWKPPPAGAFTPAPDRVGMKNGFTKKQINPYLVKRAFQKKASVSGNEKYFPKLSGGFLLESSWEREGFGKGERPELFRFAKNSRSGFAALFSSRRVPPSQGLL